MITRKIFCIFYLLWFSLICLNISEAKVTPPWSSTFDCADWIQGDTFSCDGFDLVNYGYYPTCSNKPDGRSVVNASINNPLGTGKGFRQFIKDGVNNQGAAPRMIFSHPQGEIWVRWYVRYELGYVPNLGYHKFAYIYFSGGSKVFDILRNRWSLVHQGCDSGGNDYSNVGTGFATMNGGSTGDGKWHCIEIHIKIDKGRNNGIFEAWMDGVKVMTITDTNYCGANITSIHFGVNQRTPKNNNCGYFDYDDFAISNTGYIGALGSSPSQSKVQGVTSGGR